MKQLGNIAVIAILVISIVSKLTAGNSILEGVQSNLTTASSTSISPWLKKAMNHHPRPRPPGCRSTPWICREGLHPPPARMRCCRHQCADVSSDVSNCDAETDATGGSAVLMGCVDMLFHLLYRRILLQQLRILINLSFC
ncbi:hypothetical protein DKX38_017412 [Salix brachista]|uniref:Uncharacterized protein n=1 Tax=Salix brachista TaxID=2182728 RepID=A0A5N5KWG7_9ROSI|nr:hypothetical protein DKX38_017412 [Salix brachista]